MKKTMSELKNQIAELGAQIRAAASKLAGDASNPATPIDEIDRQQAALRELNARADALRTAYQIEYDREAGELHPEPAALGAEPSARLHEMLRSNEYARAFASAVRTGARPGRGMTDERHKVLFDALTIAGNEGADGGFLVPEDIDHTIREMRRNLSPLAQFFSEETTNTNSGWRVVDTAPTAGFTEIDAEMSTVPQDDQPKFAKQAYSLKKYGLILPISNELASDEVANLFNYISRWFAKKMVLTENKLLKGLLDQNEATEIAAGADPIAALKTILNVSLDPEISVLSTILTNQSGYDMLDQLVDKNGRPMLQPDPTNATIARFAGRRVVMLSNAVLPDETEKHPLYVGDFAEYGTLFRRQNLEVVSTDIGGKAFETDSIELRCITRLGVCVFDKDAAVYRTLAAAGE